VLHQLLGDSSVLIHVSGNELSEVSLAESKYNGITIGRIEPGRVGLRLRFHRMNMMPEWGSGHECEKKVGSNREGSHHLDYTMLGRCSCEVNFTVGMTEFAEGSSGLDYMSGTTEKRGKAHDVYRHTGLVAENCCGPINVCDVSKYPWTEPYPTDVLAEI
jgi:hypothetical protein